MNFSFGGKMQSECSAATAEVAVIFKCRWEPKSRCGVRIPNNCYAPIGYMRIVIFIVITKH